jgi:hypothetical protein
MSFMRHLLQEANALTEFSIYTWWFPMEIQQVFERLFANKPIGNDVAGILSIIMFAGFGFEEEENSFFENVLIHDLFSSSDSNFVFNSQQNLAGLLFGITVDDVSKSAITFIHSHQALTKTFCCSTLVF